MMTNINGISKNISLELAQILGLNDCLDAMGQDLCAPVSLPSRFKLNSINKFETIEEMQIRQVPTAVGQGSKVALSGFSGQVEMESFFDGSFPE